MKNKNTKMNLFVALSLMLPAGGALAQDLELPLETPAAEAEPALDAFDSAPAGDTAAEQKAADNTASAATDEVAADVSETEAGAESTEAVKSRRGLKGIGLMTGLKVGAGFGQVFSPLGATFVGELELGYVLPLPAPLYDDLAVVVSAQYVQPGRTETVTATDERLAGDGSFSYDLTLYEFVASLGLLYHAPQALMSAMHLPWLDPYISVAARLHATRTKIEGDANSEAYGENNELDTRYGAAWALGTELDLPTLIPAIPLGALSIELQMNYLGMDRYVLTDTNASTVNLAVGYRAYF